MEDLLTAACSSIFPGAGTNQELALHCLHESRGDILVRPRPRWRRAPWGGWQGAVSLVQEPGLSAELIRGRQEGLTKVGMVGVGLREPWFWTETSLCRVHSSLWVVGSAPLRQGCPLRTVSICDCSLGDQVLSLEIPRVAQTQ